MDISASDWNGTTGKGFRRLTHYGTTKYDLGGKSCRTNKARSNRPCKYFASGYCRRGNFCWYSHHYQKPDNFKNYKADARIECINGRVYIAPGREGSKWSGTVAGLDIAAASSQYDPVTDSLDLIKSIISEEEAKMALTLELPRTGDLDGVSLQGTDCTDVELMAVNVKSHQLSEKEQFSDCKDEKENILKPEEITERKDGSKVPNIEGDVKVEERKEITDGKNLCAFKFALTEFVKELLSPTWRERKIDKEAYKTIVQKVVNKVIFSVQRIHIPQTQENINNYLAASKLNISKLVQAYIEIVKKEKSKCSMKLSRPC